MKLIELRHRWKGYNMTLSHNLNMNRRLDMSVLTPFLGVLFKTQESITLTHNIINNCNY